jgi:predicted ATP-dependent endonuclease of OLD family
MGASQPLIFAGGRAVFISEIRIENFRTFGSDDRAFILALNPGLTALVGENDAGKTAVIDALSVCPESP